MGVLIFWSVVSGVLLLRAKNETYLFAVEEGETRLITEKDDRSFKRETANFIKTFFENYYAYSEQDYSARISKSSDLMSADLWKIEKDKALKLSEKLKAYPLSQSFEIESLDLVNGEKVEAVLVLKVMAKLQVQEVRLKVLVEMKRVARTSVNPWGVEVVNILESTL